MMIAVRDTLVDPTYHRRSQRDRVANGHWSRCPDCYWIAPHFQVFQLVAWAEACYFSAGWAFRAWASHRNNGLAVVESRDHALIVGVRNLAMREFFALPRAGLRLPVQN